MPPIVSKTLNQHIKEAVASFDSNNCTDENDNDSNNLSKNNSDLLVEAVNELFDNVII